MAFTTQPFVMNNVSLTLKLASGGTATEYRCQLSQAELVPSAGTGGGGAALDTFCDSFSTPTGLTTWALTLSGFQAFADATDLSNFLFDNEGETLDYVLTPLGGTVSASNPAFTGQVTAVPTNIGGTAAQYAVFNGVTLPCLGKPTKDVTAVFAAEAESSDSKDSDSSVSIPA